MSQATALPRWQSLASGAAGAVSLTAAHQLANALFDDAPRMDVLAMRGLARAHAAVGAPVPEGRTLYREAMAGDLVANSLYYAAVGLGPPEHAWRRGVGLGLLAGVGAVLAPRLLDLDRGADERRPRRELGAVALYLLGGLAAAAAASAMRSRG